MTIIKAKFSGVIEFEIPDGAIPPMVPPIIPIPPVEPPIEPPTDNIIFSDDFESGEFNSRWNPSSKITIEDHNPKTGKYHAQLYFEGKDGDTKAEFRFNLGAEYQEVFIEYDLFIPENYKHRNQDSGGENNKLFRLWPADYGDDEKVGASLVPRNGMSSAGFDFRFSAGGGMHTHVSGYSYSSFITEDDLGKWMKVGYYIKAATPTSNGELQMYKNGINVAGGERPLNLTGGSRGYRYGYLWGWSNSGFDEDTYLQMDNVVFYNGNIYE